MSAPLTAKEREARSEQKRERIISAARDLASRKGFEATRMEEIAARAGVSKGTLYNFFASKQELFVATVLLAYDEFGRVLPAVEDPSLEPRKRLNALIDSMEATFGEISQPVMLAHHQAWSLVLRLPEARERLFGRLREIYTGYASRLAEILEAGIEGGQFRQDLDVEVVADTWLAAFDGLLYRSGFEASESPDLRRRGAVRRSLTWLLEQVLAPGEPGDGERPETEGQSSPGRATRRMGRDR